jgi:hypothetical protein
MRTIFFLSDFRRILPNTFAALFNPFSILLGLIEFRCGKKQGGQRLQWTDKRARPADRWRNRRSD